MNEAQRQSALQAMGIQSYFPRFIVPGAAPSSTCETNPEMFGLVAAAETRASDLAEQLLPAGNAQKTVRSDSSARMNARDLSHPERVSRSERNSPVSEAADPDHKHKEATGVSPAQLETVHFKLAFILLPDGLAVLNQLPTAGNGQMPASQQQLLGQIGKALGLGTGSRLFDAIHLFQWPMLNLPGMDNSLPAARSALLAFMEEHAQKNEISTLLIMGRQLGELMTDDKTEAQKSPVSNYKTISTYSLDQVMKMPALKPELWHTLLPLRSRA